MVTMPTWMGDPALAAETATWGDYQTFHRMRCLKRREPQTHTGTFKDAALLLLRPCLSCWPIKGAVPHNVIDRTWITIVREAHANCIRP